MILGRRFPPPLVQRRPQAARHQTPVARAASCRLARALGRVRGRGASGPPSGGRGQPKENHGRAPDRGPPPPRRRAAGGAAAPRTQAASNETGRRPTTGRGPRRQPPANTNGGEGPRAGAGQGRAAAIGRGRPGRASTGPACTRPAAYLFRSRPPPLGAGGNNRHGGGPGRRALQRPRQRAGRGAPGRPHTEQGPSLPVVGRRRRQKNAGRLAPPGWTRLDEKKCGEDALSPPRLPSQRIPDFPLFGVVVRNVLDAGQFHMLLQCGDCLVYGHVFRDRRYGRIVIQEHD